MFGTFGHARLKSGSEGKLDALMDEWNHTIRPGTPGKGVQLMGRPKDRPGEIAFVALMQDEQPYRSLANDPAQDKWYRRFMEHVEEEVTWEDVEMEVAFHD